MILWREPRAEPATSRVTGERESNEINGRFNSQPDNSVREDTRFDFARTKVTTPKDPGFSSTADARRPPRDAKDAGTRRPESPRSIAAPFSAPTNRPIRQPPWSLHRDFGYSRKCRPFQGLAAKSPLSGEGIQASRAEDLESRGVLGRKVEERKQSFPVLRQAGDGPLIVGAVFIVEHVDRPLGGRAGRRAANLPKVCLHVDLDQEGDLVERGGGVVRLQIDAVGAHVDVTAVPRGRVSARRRNVPDP